MQTKFAFICYPVTNLGRAVEFYQKVLKKVMLCLHSELIQTLLHMSKICIDMLKHELMEK